MSKMKEWLLDRQENGDDGTGLEYEPTVAACKNCKDNYFIEDLIWADSGAMAWLCQDCYNILEKEDE